MLARRGSTHSHSLTRNKIMTLARIPIATLPAAIVGGMLAADPYPEQCQIWTCSLASPATTATLAPDTLPASVLIGAQNLPVTETTTVAPSNDGELYACVGYDAFGDTELMCLLVP
jgi:hypothetical protein